MRPVNLESNLNGPAVKESEIYGIYIYNIRIIILQNFLDEVSDEIADEVPEFYFIIPAKTHPISPHVKSKII